MSEQLQNIIQSLNNYGEMYFVGSSSKESIEQFEKNHQIVLPYQFKEWLLFSDGGELFLPAGLQLYGVNHKPMIDTEDNDRPNNNYVVIGALASGDPIVFEKGSERIAIYNHEADSIEEDETYPDFFSFLNDLYYILGIGE